MRVPPLIIRVRNRELNRETLLLAALTGVFVAILLSMTSGGFNARNFDSSGGYYQRLTSGFLSGHLYSLPEPARDLVRVTEQSGFPVNPETTRPFRGYGIHDAILWDRHLYYYWGPGPILFVTLPARLVSARPSESDIGRFCLACFPLFSLMLIRGLRKTFNFGLTRAAGLLAFLSFPFSATILASRIAIWESNVLFAAIAGYGFIIIVVLAGIERKAMRFSRLGKVTAIVLLSAATLTRPESALLVLFPIAISFMQTTGLLTQRLLSAVRSHLVFAGTALVCVLLLLIYNLLRFGSLFEFGISHQIGGDDHRNLLLSSIRYIPANLYQYLVRPLNFVREFPYLDFSRFFWSFDLGGTYRGTGNSVEPVAGLIFSIPAVLLLLGGLRRGLDEQTRPILRSAMLTSLMLLVFLGYALFAASQRYRLLTDLVVVVGLAVALSVNWRISRQTTLQFFLLMSSVVLALLAAAHGYGASLVGPVPNNSYVKTLSGIFAAVGTPRSSVNDVAGPRNQSDQIRECSIPSLSKSGEILRSHGSLEFASYYFSGEIDLPADGFRGSDPLVSFGPPGQADVLGISWDGHRVWLIHDHWGFPPRHSAALLLNPGNHQLTIGIGRLRMSTIIDGHILIDKAPSYGLTSPIAIGINAIGATTVSPSSRIGLRYASLQDTSCVK